MKLINPDLIQQWTRRPSISKPRPGVAISIVASALEGEKPEDDYKSVCHLLAIDNRDSLKFEKFFKNAGIKFQTIEVNKTEFYEPRS